MRPATVLLASIEGWRAEMVFAGLGAGFTAALLTVFTAAFTAAFPALFPVVFDFVFLDAMRHSHRRNGSRSRPIHNVSQTPIILHNSYTIIPGYRTRNSKVPGCSRASAALGSGS